MVDANPAEAAPSESPGHTSKPIHSLILDTGPLIKNDPPVDVLRAQAEELYILPSVVPEIRDTATRTRVETTLLPFVTLRSPQPESVKFITDFARRTGDLEVLSRPDIEVLALAYELERERNGGDWRLRSTPGQKTLNGRPPARDGATEGEAREQEDAEQPKSSGGPPEANPGMSREAADQESLDRGIRELHLQASGAEKDAVADPETAQLEAHNMAHEGAEASDMAGTKLSDGEKEDEAAVLVEEAEKADSDDQDEDDGGWITPSNVKKKKAKDSNTTTSPGQQPTTLQAAVLTSDFAMQNVALRMNLNLVSPSLTRISRLKTWVLRCHGCFKITRDMDRRFCPQCGQPNLIRAACTVDDRTGDLTVHLKKNFQWNNRGNVYSVPKPVHGSANGRLPKSKGKNAGGKNGWGQNLILAEDQKEYTKATNAQRRERKKDLMDEDHMPGILSGDRPGSGGRIRVGAGRNVNARRKH